MRTSWRIAPTAGVLALLLGAGPAQGLSVAGFDASLAAGAVRGLPIAFGAGGEVFDLAARVVLPEAVASPDALPTGLDLDFDFAISADASDLTLRYAFENTTSSVLPELGFLSYVDAEIDEPLNTFFNEFATVEGSPAPGQGYEVDEPGYVSGDLLANVEAGLLDGTNALPAGRPDDVAFALSFTELGIGPGEIAEFRILLSEDGDRLGSLALVQQDTGPRASGTTLTFSGESRVRPGGPTMQPAIPEPTGLLLFAAGLVLATLGLRRAARRDR